jgi:hypothetical protein
VVGLAVGVGGTICGTLRVGLRVGEIIFESALTKTETGGIMETLCLIFCDIVTFSTISTIKLEVSPFN